MACATENRKCNGAWRANGICESDVMSRNVKTASPDLLVNADKALILGDFNIHVDNTSDALGLAFTDRRNIQQTVTTDPLRIQPVSPVNLVNLNSLYQV